MKRRRMLMAGILMAVGLLCIWGGLASAVPLTFTESGDFGGSAPTIIAQPLDVGINTINGSVPVKFGDRDSDVFQVSVPSSLLVGLIQINVTNYIGVTGEQGLLGLFTPNSGSKRFSSNGLFTLGATLNDPSTLTFRVIGPESDSPHAAGSFDYTVSIDVEASPVPEPSTWLLVATGIIGLLGYGWWRRSA